MFKTGLEKLQVRPNEPAGVENVLTLSFHFAYGFAGSPFDQVTVSTFVAVVTFLIDQMKSVESAFGSIEYP